MGLKSCSGVGADVTDSRKSSCCLGGESEKIQPVGLASVGRASQKRAKLNQRDPKNAKAELPEARPASEDKIGPIDLRWSSQFAIWKYLCSARLMVSSLISHTSQFPSFNVPIPCALLCHNTTVLIMSYQRSSATAACVIASQRRPWGSSQLDCVPTLGPAAGGPHSHA